MDNISGKVRRLKTAKSQIGSLRFAGLFLSKLAAKLFDPYLLPSYSQFGEDRIIDSFFLGQSEGFYVDVGCNHPVSLSNTWKLYLRGWNGICIDPNPSMIDLFRKIRPKDLAIQKAVSDVKRTVDFYFSKESHLTSGIGQKTTGRWKRTHENSIVVKCETVALSDVFAECNVDERFDLLSVDVEGHELEVLDSVKFHIYRPRLVVVEMHQFDFEKPERNSVYAKLKSHGYSMVSYVCPSGFFADLQPGADSRVLRGL